MFVRLSQVRDRAAILLRAFATLTDEADLKCLFDEPMPMYVTPVQYAEIIGLPISPVFPLLFFRGLSSMIIMAIYHMLVCSANSDRSLCLSSSSFLLHLLSATVVSLFHIVLVNLILRTILKAYFSLPLSLSLHLSLIHSISLSVSLSLYLSLYLSISLSLSISRYLYLSLLTLLILSLSLDLFFLLTYHHFAHS